MGYDPGYSKSQGLIDINARFAFVYQGIYKFIGKKGMGTMVTAVVPQGAR